jgi:hypothetical protein
MVHCDAMLVVVVVGLATAVVVWGGFEQVHGHVFEINSVPHDSTNPAQSAFSVQSSANTTGGGG